MSRTLASLAILIVLVIVASWGLSNAGVSENTTTAIVGGIFGIYPTVVTSATERKKTNQERIAELVKGDAYIHPALVTFYIFCYLQFVERTLGFLFGAVVATAITTALPTSDLTAQTLVTQTVPMVSPIFVNLVLIFAIVPIAIYSTHRVKRFPFLWIALAILIDQVISLAVAALFLQTTVPIEAVIVQAAFAALLIPGAVIGIFWARRTHLRYIMARLFRRLPPPDQRSLIDLVETLPGGSTT
jgi:hypothetical protein